MPKMKTRRGAAKRLKRTGSGKLVRYKGHKSHLLTHKTAKRKRRLRKQVMLHASDERRMEKLVPYL
ncbi:MAG TPA: 50S ribosomal protein L35 [Firmicutes bacterium]|nr:50S ribosomal protein L35 [Bacillota bacterium]